MAQEASHVDDAELEYCAIHSLPGELLAVIFILVRDSCVEDDAEHGVPGWVLSLTHTCALWRAIALHTQLLWSILPRQVSLLWQQSFIERSGDMSLELALQFPALTSSAHDSESIHRTAIAGDMVQSNLWRTSSLSLLFDPLGSYPAEGLKCLLSVPAPELRTFRMDAADAQSAELPRELFKQHAPKLTSIILDNGYFTWSSLAFPELVELKVNHSDGVSRKTLKSTFPELLSLLAGLPKLRWLELHLYHHSPSELPPPEPVSLPDIQVVQLRGSGEIVDHLLQNLQLPPTASILLETSSTPYLIAKQPYSLMHYLKTYFHAPAVLALRFTEDMFCLQLALEPILFLGGYGSMEAASLTVEHTRPDFLWFRSFADLAHQAIREGLTLSNLTSLHIESELVENDPVGTWTSILRYALALEHLGLQGTALPEICAVISSPIDEERAKEGRAVDNRAQYLLSSLQQLSLWEVSFDLLVDMATEELAEKGTDTMHWDVNGAVVRDPEPLSNPEQRQTDLLEWIWDDSRFDWISALRRRAQGWKPLEKVALKQCSGPWDRHWEEYFFGHSALSVGSQDV